MPEWHSLQKSLRWCSPLSRRRKAREVGREPDEVLVVAGIVPITRRTKREASTASKTKVLYAHRQPNWCSESLAEEIADAMVLAFDQHAVDGFNVLATTVPEGLQDLVELVIPELRRG